MMAMVACIFPTHAAVITVTTTNNPGAGSLLEALSNVHDGDEIQFNIPGPGPHYFATPFGGYPYITANDITIDGYSQPGAVANSNSILQPNNAQIKIVLDSRNGNSKLMDFPGDTPDDDTGYGDTESAILGVLGATNVTIRGLSLLAVPLTGAIGDVALYGVSFARGANGHINGCWIGVGPDGQSGFGFGPADGVTGFRFQDKDGNNVVTNRILVSGVTVGVAKESANPRAEFNVITGIPAIPIILEGENHRIAGNFLEVLPDGKQDYNPALDPDIPADVKPTFEGAIEIGRAGNNTIIGVDGDGVNDAEERNIIGGTVPPSLLGYDHTLEFYSQNPGTNIVIAGNYIGVGIDGTTRFTNGVPPCNAPSGAAVYRFGSDFDGVSDALEGNVVYNNWPPNLFGAASPDFQQNFFDELADTTIVSLRGNTLVNNFTPPVNPLKNGGEHLTNYYSRVVADTNAPLTPVLFGGVATNRLRGQVPLPNSNYPVVILDVYLPDPEGIVNGISAGIAELPDGFIQGRSFLGSFVVDGPADLNPLSGVFEFDINGWGVTDGTLLTVTANYSQSPAGTHNAPTVTSLFSVPVVSGLNPGPMPEVPSDPPGSGPPGPYPNFSLTAANWIATSGTTYDGTVNLDLAEEGPIAWSCTKINRGDFAVRLSPANAVAAKHNLGVLQDWGNSRASDPSGQAWRPNREAGVIIPTVRQNGPIDWNDTTGPFYPTIAASYTSSGSGYDMITGTFANGDCDIQTGKAGGPGSPWAEGNFNFATTWFPYDQGWIAGVTDNPDPATGDGRWASEYSHSPGLSATMLKGLDLGSGIYGGSVVLDLPGVNSLNDGMLFTTSSQGNSDLDITASAPKPDGKGWVVSIREDFETDPQVVATNSPVSNGNESMFQFVYIPYACGNLVGGQINGATGTKAHSRGDFTIARTDTGTYELTIPGKTGANGVLLLQNAGFLVGSTTIADNNFLSYEFNPASGKFLIQARHTVANNSADLGDTDFYVAWVDFANPLTPPGAVATGISLGPVTRSGSTLTLTWSGGNPPYQVQRRTSWSGGTWASEGAPTSSTTATVPINGSEGYFRIQSQ